MSDHEMTDSDRFLLRERILSLRESVGHSLYALMDVARDPFLLPAIMEGFGADHQCLFRGQAKEVHGDNTAWIVRIEHHQGLLDWLLDEGWGRRVVSFVVSPLPISRMTSHLRKFTKVKDSAGTEHFFRFYDPKVMRQYLPVFGPREHEMFFREVSCCAIEDTRKSATLLIGRSSGSNVAWEEWHVKACVEEKA